MRNLGNISELYKQVQKNSFKRAILNLSEKLGANATMGDYISDFQKSDAPQFKGRTKEQRKKMAIAAYLDKTGQTREELELDENVKAIEKMMKDRKYKGNTSAFDAAVKKKFPKEYEKDDVQDLIRKHAEKNEELDKDDEGTVKKVIGKLKKASQAHADQAKTLTKDLQDEKELDENVSKKYKGKEQKAVDMMIRRQGIDTIQKLHDKDPKKFDAMVKRLSKSFSEASHFE